MGAHTSWSMHHPPRLKISRGFGSVPMASSMPARERELHYIMVSEGVGLCPTPTELPTKRETEKYVPTFILSSNPTRALYFAFGIFVLLGASYGTPSRCLKDT
jgi:hypothetical protein